MFNVANFPTESSLHDGNRDNHSVAQASNATYRAMLANAAQTTTCPSLRPQCTQGHRNPAATRRNANQLVSHRPTSQEIPAQKRKSWNAVNASAFRDASKWAWRSEPLASPTVPTATLDSRTYSPARTHNVYPTSTYRQTRLSQLAVKAKPPSQYRQDKWIEGNPKFGSFKPRKLYLFSSAAQEWTVSRRPRSVHTRGDEIESSLSRRTSNRPANAVWNARIRSSTHVLLATNPAMNLLQRTTTRTRDRRSCTASDGPTRRDVKANLIFAVPLQSGDAETSLQPATPAESFGVCVLTLAVSTLFCRGFPMG